MRARLKSHLSIGGSIAILMALLFALLAHVVSLRFAALEKDEMRLNVDRVKLAIEQELVSLNSKAGDWSNWDDCYAFALGTDPGFIQANMGDETFRQLAINTIVLVSPSGELLYGGEYDLDGDAAVPLPQGIFNSLAAGSQLVRRAEEDGQLTGVLSLPSGPMLVAIRPILTTNGEGPSVGTLLFGRYLDAAEEARLAAQTRLSVQLLRFDDGGVPDDFGVAAADLRSGSEVYTTTLGREKVAGYGVLEDLLGDPAILLRVDAPRTVFRQGRAMLAYFGVAILLFGLLAGVVIIWLFERLLRSRGEQAEAEGRYRAVVEQSIEAILLVDPSTERIQDANRAFLRLTGYSPEEAAALRLRDLEFDLQQGADSDRPLAPGAGHPSTSARQWRHKDGHGLDVEVSVGRVAFGGQGLVCLVVRDVSARRKAERALRLSEERLRGVFENTLVGIFQIAPDGRVLFANPALAQILGLPGTSELLAKGIGSDRSALLSGLIPRPGTGAPAEVRGRILSWTKPDGSTARVRVNARPVHGQEGGTSFIEGTVEDITELLEAQDELARKARYRVSLNRVIAAVGTSTTAGGMLTACLDSTLQGLELAAGGVWVGKQHHFVDLPGDVRPALEARDSGFHKVITIENSAAAQPEGVPPSVAVSLQRAGIAGAMAFPIVRDGHRIGGMLIASSQPRAWLADEVTLGEAVAEEIAAGLHRIEMAERTQHQERLAAVGQLAAGIAHDFNNILSAVILHAELLMEEPGLSGRAAGRTRTILEQGRRASSLVAQVLDFSRRSVLEMEPVDFLKFLRDQVRLIERTIPETIRIQLEAEEGDFLLRADLTRLQQVLLNLSTNARDAMPRGGSLTFSLQRCSYGPQDPRPFPEMPPGEWVVLRVSDSGMGIPEDVTAHLFEPFFTTKPPGKGTGLGLSQVYGIIKQHEGYIDVSSSVTSGTTFTLWLPALASTWPSVADPAVRLTRGTGETLLLVEDEEAARDAMTDVLEGLGYRVICAANGRQGLELYQEHADQIRLVISDMVMPEMGGQGLHERLVQLRPDLKMILISGYPMGGTGQLHRFGGTTRLQKPVGRQTLAAAVRQALDGPPGDPAPDDALAVECGDTR